MPNTLVLFMFPFPIDRSFVHLGGSMSHGDSHGPSLVTDVSDGFQILGRRKAQEDALAVRRGSCDGTDALFVVLADGHGEKGADAAQIAVEAGLDLWDDGCWHGRAFASTARPFFADVHRRICMRDKNSGACLTVVLAIRGGLHVAWAGNVEAWVGSDPLERLTVPHEPSVHSREASRVTEAGGGFQPCPPERCFSGSRPCYPGHGYVVLADGSLSLEVSRAVGHPRYEPIVVPDPEIVERVIVPGTRLVVGSDGAWNVLRPLMGEVSGAVSHLLPDFAAKMVGETVRRRNPADNASMIFVDLDGFCAIR